MRNAKPFYRVFRFVNDIGGPHSPDFRSAKSLLKPRDLKRRLESGLTIEEEQRKLKTMSRQVMANLTAGGELRLTSHMIPVLEDPRTRIGDDGTCGQSLEILSRNQSEPVQTLGP